MTSEPIGAIIKGSKEYFFNMTKILLAFSWGHQFPKPGLSNETMAEEIKKIKIDFDYILVQVEISEALKSIGVQADYVIGELGVYMNTHEVVKAMREWLEHKMIEVSIANIQIMCHRAHWKGLKLILRKFKISAQRIPIDIPYDPNSSQYYTRGPLRAFIGKILHFIGYLFRGELF